MKKRTKNTLLSILCCGLLATSVLGVTAGLKVSAETERVAPTGKYTGTLTGAIADSMLETFQVYGASTRTASPNGLRFLTTIENSDLALIPQGAEFGTILLPYNMLDGELTKDTANALVAPAMVDTDAEEVPANGIGYYITLVGSTLENQFPTNLYGTVFAARAYVKYMYENAYGELVEDYAYSTKTTYRSIGYVASCELAMLADQGTPDNDENSFLNRIVSEVANQKEMSVSLLDAEIDIGDTTGVMVSGISDGVNEFAHSLSSSNTAVAEIGENGEIVALSAGTTTITARIGLTERSVELTVTDPNAAETFTGGNILYSTKDGTIFMPDGLLDEGETIVSAQVNGVDYFDENGWTALALTDAEIGSNTVKTTTLTVKTSEGDAYYVDALSYAGVIDELSDFPKFFNNDPNANAPVMYGYYIVTKNLGTGTEELAFTQTTMTDYSKTSGFNGVLDGQGYTLKFKLTSGALVGMVLGNAVIKNLSIIFEDATSTSYGVFGYVTNGAPEIRNCYIQQTNNHYMRTTVWGLMARPNNKLRLHNTVVFGSNISFDNTSWSATTINENSTNAFVIWARATATSFGIATNFTEVSTSGALTSDLSVLDGNYWNTTDNKPSWKTVADAAVSVYDEAYQSPIQQLEDRLLYSTQDGQMILPDSLQGATIIDAYSEDKTMNYYENGAWQNLALTTAEINANATKNTTIVIETDRGNYLVTATSYAGVIDELSDFPVFFNNEAIGGYAPETFGHYIVTKDLGDGTEELAFTQCKEINWSANCGFSGILDGQGHTLRFKLTSGGLVGMLLGNATIKNLGVIFEDLTTTKYGVFGYFTRLNPVIENCYIEQTNNHFSRTTTFGVMARPNGRLVLKNTVVYGYNISMQNDSGAVNVSAASSNAYVIHARDTANTLNIATNFTKVFNDGLENYSREVALSEIADESGFNGDYWYKENGKLIWKGWETVNITWVVDDQATVEPFTKGHYMQFPELENAYWSKTENGSQATLNKIVAEEDDTYYLVSTTKTLTESAYYSTLDNELFLPTAFTNTENSFESITSADGSIVYYENEEWVRNFALTSSQIADNQMMLTPIKINVADGAYLMTVKSYAGVIDELSDFPKYFNNEANSAGVAPSTYGYYAIIKNIGELTDNLAMTQCDVTDYTATCGFNGIVDGLGHTVRFSLTSGALFGMILGNCTIQNLAVEFNDNTVATANVVADYGVFGYITHGAPQINNCYIAKQNNRYLKATTYGLMARPNGGLVLNNTVVLGSNVTMDNGSYTASCTISANSTNAFVTWCRSTSYTINTNFTESSTNGVLTSDLSVLDSKYWDTTNKTPAWKGADDVAVISVGTVTVAPKALEVYKIVLPETLDDSGTLEFAKDELILFFAEATGANLEVASDNAYSTNDAYISIGNTKMYKKAALDLGGASGQGYRIQTVDNSLFINAETTLGCLYGVYGLLEELFGYEQFSVDCYTLNKVELDTLPVVDVIENPSFNARQPVSGTVTANDAYAMRLKTADTIYILPAGDYRYNNGAGWRDNHNVLEILPPDYWKGQGKTNWFSDDGEQLCYTAHGNSADYAAMVAQIVDAMTLTLGSDTFLGAAYANAKYIAISGEDGDGYCTCSACKTAKATYGSDAGAAIKLCNDVREGLETWMNNNPKYKRDLTLLFLAYNKYFDAPVVKNQTTGKYELKGGLTLRSDVGIWVAGSSYAQYYYHIDHANNADFKDAFQRWADVTEASGSDLCVWTYSLNNNEYLIHTDMYGENTFFNETAYQYFESKGVDMYYNQGPWDATETVTAFNRLNIYLDSQLQWDNTQSVTDLTDKYFNAMYGAGASYMKQLYNAENAASRELFDPDIEGVPNDQTDSFESWWGVLSSSNINKWLGYITSAKNAVNADTTLTDEQKAAYIDHINEEWIAVKYWQMRYHGSSSSLKATAKAEFREVLGYNSTTKEYAKDVTIGERYDYTLAAWVENNFSAP